MKNCKATLALVVFAIFAFSCKDKSVNPDGGTTPGTTTVKKDSGFVVVYLNDYIYTDTNNGATKPDNIDVSVGNISKGKISSISSNTKVYYGTKGGLSLKLPVGGVTISGITTSQVTRSVSVNIIKNDTIKIKLDYAFKDPNSNLYYIEYYDNGLLKKYTNNLKSWNFYVNNYQALVGTLPGCSTSIGSYNYDGPSYQPSLVSVPPSNVLLMFSRPSWKLKPNLGSYTINSRSLDFSCGGSRISCDKSDSYATVVVSEVKILEDMGLEKRGYYTGTFDAILYYTPNFFSTPEKHVITKGKFFAYMGGLSFQF